MALAFTFTACEGPTDPGGFLDTTPPANVNALNADPGNGQVTLSWTNPADPDLDRIEITFTPVVPNQGQPLTIAKEEQGRTITGLTNKTVYTFTVKTVDSKGNKSDGTTVTATPVAAGVTQYTITFTVGEGFGTTPESRTVSTGTIITLPGQESMTAPGGKVFAGWKAGADDTILPAGSPYTVTADVTFTAQWDDSGSVTQYTITFTAGEGFGTTPESRTVSAGTSITLPGQESMTPPGGKVFAGWESGGSFYWGGDSYTVTADVTFTALWWETASMPTGLSLAASLAWLSANAEGGGSYTIVLSGNETIAPSTLSYDEKTVRITLTGGAAERTVSLSSTGSLFTVKSGVTLTLDNNVTLSGTSDNTASLVQVDDGALVMNTGSKIHGNTSPLGGGVYINYGAFTMNGGTISGNTVVSSNSFRGGGGVYVYADSSTITMSGGTISGNTVSPSSYSSLYGGGGVYVYSGTFTMSGGTIRDNTAFSLTGGGGGVYVYDITGTFTMTGGTITGNTAGSCDGGGVHAHYGTFTMTGGTISGNTASRGGGVFVFGTKFTKSSDGIIYGTDASDDALKNTVTYNDGHAVYGAASPVRIRNTTVGEGAALDAGVSGAEGGWVEQDWVTVTFDADGGSPETQMRSVAPGASLGALNMPSTPTRTNYTFGGWYTGQNGGGTQFTAATTVSGTITVYARWTIIQYTVTFNADGGSPSTQTRTVNSGASVGAENMPTEPVQSGSTFGGWYTATSGGGTQFTAATTVSGNITVYAKWTITQYTVTFDVNGGGGSAPASQTVNVGTAISLPGQGSMTPSGGKAFAGWESGGSYYWGGDSYTVTGNVTFTARWWETSSMPAGLSLAVSLAWISANAQGGGSYTIVLSGDETSAPSMLSYSGKTVGITLTGGAAVRKVNLGSNGSLFTVGSGVTLTLGNNVTLRGRNYNTASLVRVNGGGRLVMNAGSEIGYNTVSSASTSSYGGGVYVGGGTFTMEGGTIRNNTASASTDSYGGGVYVSGTFTMSGGTISGNTAAASSSDYSTSSDGGGVYVSSGTFIMSGGTISGNTAAASSSNISPSHGGGVYVYKNGTFTMSGGTISGNTAEDDGGGVYVASLYISGEYQGSGVFSKEPGGVIYGQDAEYALRNTSSQGFGHAVYVFQTDTDSSKKRDSTAGEGVTLDSTKSGWAGGWE
jgi:uncharacterized repeat protein (TIGR02543 family)